MTAATTLSVVSPRLRIRENSSQAMSDLRAQRGSALDGVDSGAAMAWQVRLLLISLFIPGILHVGPVAVSLYRIVLLILIVPCLARWISGRAGGVKFPDLALLSFCIWCGISLIVVNGPQAALQSGGILFVETMGAYLVARCYVRTADQFLAMVKLLFVLMMIILPFAIIEAVFKKNIPVEFFSNFIGTMPGDDYSVRWGLKRVQSVFDHPILYGACIGSLFALSHFVLGFRKPLIWRWFRNMIVAITAFLSLSSAPIAMIVLQTFLMGWDRVLAERQWRWKLLGSMAVMAYVVVDLLSNQTPIQFYISRFTFDGQTGWYRIAIWDYGTASVANYPIFGVGLGEWARPFWMTSSIDNFWLIHFVRYGVPAGIFMIVAFLSSLVIVGAKSLTSERLIAYRKGYMIVMMGFFMVGWTVHLWSSAYVLFLFLMGSGIWLLETSSVPGDVAAVENERGAANRRVGSMVRKSLRQP